MGKRRSTRRSGGGKRAGRTVRRGGKRTVRRRGGKRRTGGTRKLSGYMKFAAKNRTGIKAKNPNASFGQLGKLIGAAWRGLSEAEKKVYKAL